MRLADRPQIDPVRPPSMGSVSLGLDVAAPGPLQVATTRSLKRAAPDRARSASGASVGLERRTFFSGRRDSRSGGTTEDHPETLIDCAVQLASASARPVADLEKCFGDVSIVRCRRSSERRWSSERRRCRLRTRPRVSPTSPETTFRTATRGPHQTASSLCSAGLGSCFSRRADFRNQRGGGVRCAGAGLMHLISTAIDPRACNATGRRPPIRMDLSPANRRSEPVRLLLLRATARPL